MRRIARTSDRAALLFAALLAAGCASAPGGSAPTPQSDPTVAIPAMLRSSAESWNAGDLDGFLDDYLDSPQTTFVGSSVTRGRAEVRKVYERVYWQTGRPKDALRFEDIEVRRLGNEHALTLGRYILYDRNNGATTASGYFSLVLVRTADGWRIIHDHSSSAQ